MLTPSELMRLFETGDEPDGSAFAELITSLRSKLESIPATQVAGLAAAIEAVVDAKLASIGQRQIVVYQDGPRVAIREGDTPIGVIDQAAPDRAGLLAPEDKAKLDALPADASANKTTEEIVSELRTQPRGWLPADAIEGLIAPRLVAVDVNGSNTYEVDAETLIYTFYVMPTSDGTVRIGTSPSAGDVLDTEGIADEPITAPLQELTTNQTTLYFSGQYQVKFKIESYA